MLRSDGARCVGLWSFIVRVGIMVGVYVQDVLGWCAGRGALSAGGFLGRDYVRRRSEMTRADSYSQDIAFETVAFPVFSFARTMRSTWSVVHGSGAAAAFSHSSLSSQWGLILSLPPQRSDNLVKGLLNIDAVLRGGFNEITTHLLCQRASLLRGHLSLRDPITLVSNEHDWRLTTTRRGGDWRGKV